MSEWIENELARELKPVTAPETLWNRVAAARPRARRELRWLLWPAFAGLVLLASSEIRYHAERPSVTTRSSVRAVAARPAQEACLQCHTEKL